MNKIININLAGRLVPIDEEAYETLTQYLAALKHFFDQEEGGSEILHDMEDRIGELFQDKIKKGAAAISQADVSSIIEIMGRPEQIAEEAGEEAGAASDPGLGAEAGSGAAEHDSRRLTRSSKEKVLGGVCGGLAVHFNIDPVVVRVIFALISLAWGTGVLVYFLLWILLPESDVAAQGFKRRLYRNPDQKIIGGVCSGIAAYLNIDAMWVRLIFLLPFISGLSIGLFDDFILPFTFGGIPLLFLLYVILWIALPKATTVAEKLEMRGKKIDIRNLSDAIKNTPDASSSGSRSRSHFWVVLFKILGFIVGGMVLLVVFGLLLGLALSFFRFGTSFYSFPWIGLVTDNPLHQKLLVGALILVLVIPAYALVRGAVYLLSGKSVRGPKWLRVSTVLLFIGSVFTLFWIIGSVAGDFKVRYHTTQEVTLNPIVSDTLVITGRTTVPHYTGSGEGIEQVWVSDDLDFFRILDDATIAVENIRLKIVKSPDSLFHLQVEKSAYGKNAEVAKRLAVPLDFDFSQSGNTLYLPAALRLSAGQPFRGQQLTAIVSVPEGKVFYLEDIEDSHWQSRRYGYDRGRIFIESSWDGKYDDHHYYRMDASGEGRPLEGRDLRDDHWE